MASGTRRTLYLMYMTTFALVTPIGMALGIGISALKNEGSGYDITVATLQGAHKIFETEKNTFAELCSFF